MDNLSTHNSKETRLYLASKTKILISNSNNRLFIKTIKKRFIISFLPKHGSWLNAVEGVFSKLSRNFLKNIRVNSRLELENRIYQAIEELNVEPKPPNWKNCIDKYFNK